MARGYSVSSEELNRQNRLAIRYFAIAGIPVAIANTAAQSIVQGVPALTPKNLILLGYFVVLFLADRFLIPRQCKHATTLVYLVVAPVMIISILLGTIWDPTHQAITFPMFMSIIPVFILDHPARSIGVSLAWNIAFLACVVAFKDPSVHDNDFVHAAEFFFVSLAVTNIVVRLRLEVVYNLGRANYHLEHDVLTNTQNRLCFETHAEQYVGDSLYVTVGNVDHLALINDFYGTEAGDEVIDAFARTLKGLFSADHTYRYSGERLLCIMRDGRAQEGEKLVRTCMKQMHEYRFEAMRVAASSSFGAVTGTPKSVSELTSMIQLATIYSHQAQRKGEGQYVFSRFGEEALHLGIIQSNIGMHARSYEISQLTGLPTLPYFVIHTQELLEHVVDLSREPHIGFLNINHFRTYNERHGYTQGDKLIGELALILKENLPNRHIAYITGSQFCMMCYHDEIDSIVDAVCAGVAQIRPDESLAIRAGFAEYHEGDSINGLLDKARIARRHVGDGQLVRYRIYDKELDEQIRMSKYLVSHLDKALEEGWLQVFYQPIMWSSTQKLCNMEALSRWVDPVYGMLSPARFIGALEREQLIYKLSLHVVRRALEDLNTMRDRGLPLVPISINLSRNDFFACDMVEEISALVEKSGLPTNLICIEITESAVAQSQELLNREVARFHERGFSVWMDDFGSEYSTLNLLQELDFDLVKLDMRFMRNFVSSGRNAVIVSSVIEMCARLGMETLVEGVEEEVHVSMLREMGADKQQGYFFSRPLPFEEVIELAQRNEWL
ncbi:MAG: EAL domain-containing protein [Atopobiaceae bacterium]|nr:EAL domain-containing protein [Atopobiaceae bacterium]